jgi:DNA-damage-inducible protein J
MCLKGVINMAQINIRIDDNLKEKAEILFEELGLNMSTAFNIFIRQSIRQGGIPFEITTRVDPFFSESNIGILKESIKEADEGKFISKSLEELRELE